MEIFLEKFWGKPISIPVIIILLGIGSIAFLPKEDEHLTSLLLYILFALALLLIYCNFVAKTNKLPHCKKDEIGVLFVLKVASEEQYLDFKHSIENNFIDNLKEHNIKIVPICVNAVQLKNYDKNNATYMAKLLSSTNCYFCIEFFVESDSINKPTKYRTTINTGVLHPNVSKQAVDFLIKNLSFGTTPIKSLKFTTKDKIDVLKTASQYLAILSQYAISILLIMSNKIPAAISMLVSLHSAIDCSHILYKMISETLYEVSARHFHPQTKSQIQTSRHQN